MEIPKEFEGIEMLGHVNTSDPRELAKNMLGKFFQLATGKDHAEKLLNARMNLALCISELTFAFDEIGHVSKKEFWAAVRSWVFKVTV